MKTSNISFAPFFFLSILLILFAASDSLSFTDQSSFLQCLDTHSQPSHPISNALYFPGNSSYSSTLLFYMQNQRFNEPGVPKPRLILTASHVSHIQAAVICAKSHGLELRIRGLGHCFEGVSYVSSVPFFVLDTFNLNAINVDLQDETAWVEAGATLGEVYHKISEKSNVHAFPGGMYPTVGVGGQVSGGGFGNLVRKYGLAADNVVDAKLIDVNGRLLDRASMGEDLFWAITGGGASSFGVVLAYKIRLVRVPPTVTYAEIQMTKDNNKEFTNVVRKYLQVVDRLDDDIYIELGVDVVEKTTIRGTFLALFLGNSEKLVSLLKESFPELGLEKSNCIEMSWIESVARWNKLPNIGSSSSNVLLNRAQPAPIRMKRKTDFLKKSISKTGLEFIFKKMVKLETPVLKFYPFGGIMSDISSSAKPFPHREGNIAMVEIATDWIETGTEASNYYINLTRKFYAYLTPFVSKSRGAYVNYRDIDLGINRNGADSYSEAKGYGLKYYKGNFEKLVEIKSKVDPDNFFRNEQSVPVLTLISSE